MSSKELEVEEEEEDQYDARINKSGCAKYHYALQVRCRHSYLASPASWTTWTGLPTPKFCLTCCV
jgi:hypothetical protein